MTDQEPLLLTFAQAASLLGLSEATVRRIVRNDGITTVRLPGGELRVPRQAVLALANPSPTTKSDEE